MRRWLGLAFLISIAHAQAPDVRFNLNGILSYQVFDQRRNAIRFYDLLGRTTTVQLRVGLENQYRVFVSERLEAIPNDPSRDPFEEYYIEDQRLWHLGKQFLPFGSGHFLRENVLAARADTDLAFENLNISAAVCDGGPGAQRGIIGRIGSWYGVSAAIGKHFGIAPTSLDLVRHPDETPGLDHGWRNAFGFDATKQFGPYRGAFETVWLTKGEDGTEDLAITDLSGQLRTDANHTILAGWTHQWDDRADFYRLSLSQRVGTNQFIEPLIRVKDGRLYDFSVTLRVRL